MVNVKFELTDFLVNFSPVYPDGGTWDDTVKLLTSDPIESITVTRLVDTLIREGKFREPIMVSEKEDDDGNLLGVWHVSNGTHRVVAHILTGTETVYAIEHPSYSEDYEYVAISATLCFANETEYNSLKHEDLFDYFCDRLRSFPVNDNVWVDADIIFGTKGGLEFTYSGATVTAENLIAIETSFYNAWAMSPFKDLVPKIEVKKWVDDFLEED